MGKKCICCGSKNNKYIHSEKEYNYFECNKCGFIFSPTIEKQYFPKRKKLGQDEINFWKKWGERRKSFFLSQLKYIKKLKPHGKALDVGCGTGAFLDILKESYDAYGIEPNIILCNTGNRLYNNRIKNCLLYDVKDKYDLVYLMDVVEHMPQPDIELINLKKVMKSDAIVVIRVPNASYVKFKKFFFDLLGLTKKFKHGCFGAPGHLYHFSKKSLFSLLENNGFKIIKYCPTRSNIEDRLFARIISSGLYYFGLVLYFVSFGKINIVIDHLVYAKEA
ncbi:MAG: class I SAM-dependent methyltransferase [archaeon]